jgi:peptidoglycan/xylan/chitin deacetylase (PgdA/CDA1 family)
MTGVANGTATLASLSGFAMDGGAKVKLAPAARAGIKSRVKRLVAQAIPRAVLVRRGSGGARRVALTFDDGPDQMSDAYLDVLDRFGARATFFVVGEACVARREALLRMVARGHEVAGHGFTHDPFTRMTAAGLRSELHRTSALLPPVAAGRPLVRPPTGATSLRSLALTAQAGYTTVLWSRDSDDCRTMSADVVAARLAPSALTPGDIVLLHEGQTWTLAALPRILEGLASAGWRAVTVSEILQPRDEPGDQPKDS